MKPAPLTYHRAASATEAIGLIAGHQGVAKFLAGGQSLGPMINLRLVQPDLVVDVSRLPELLAVGREKDRLLVGAGTPHAAFEDGDVPDVANGLLRHVASGIAYRSVRNRGTLGGSLAHADPSADWPAVMMALDARIRIIGPEGRRSMAVDGFLRGAMTTALAEDELIEAVEIPVLTRAARWGFDKRCRMVGHFAHALAVAVCDPGRKVHRVVVGATGGAPLHLVETSRALAGKGGWRNGREAEIRAAYEADLDASNVVFDEYDRQVHGLAVVRAAKGALSP